MSKLKCWRDTDSISDKEMFENKKRGYLVEVESEPFRGCPSSQTYIARIIDKKSKYSFELSLYRFLTRRTSSGLILVLKRDLSYPWCTTCIFFEALG